MSRLLFLLLFTVSLGYSQEYYFYAAAESDDTVSLISFDGETLTEEERIPVGVMKTENEGPHGLTVDPSGEYWYLSLAHGTPYGSLVKYSTTTNRPVDKTTLGMFPASMQISSLTGLLYCVNFNLHGEMKPSSVSVVDPETMTEIKQIQTGVMPHGSRISPNGRFQYSVAMMSGELFEVDALSLEVNRTLSLDEGGKMSHKGMHHSPVKPTWVTPHPTKPIVYVAGNGSNEIIEIDTDLWKITNRIDTGKGPYNIDVSSDGKYLAATLKGDAKTLVWEIDKKKKSVVSNNTSVTHGVVISPDSKYAFVTVEGIGGEPGLIDVIDLKKTKVVASLEIGKQAGGIAFWKIEE
jgi:DNA-binding beta-propeller fold protein YncE